MIKGRELATAAFTALAMLACLGAKADAAQCGSTGADFEAWKGQFAEEARAKGVGASSVAALTQTNYATATIAADRGQRSFGLSLDQFLAKRGASTIVARGRALKQSQAALFASIQQRYGVPPGPLLAIWGMETGFGSQHGNQNMLSSIATLAYDCRRSEYFTEQLYAEFPQGPWLARRRRIPTGRSQFRGHRGMECRACLSARHRADGPSDRR